MIQFFDIKTGTIYNGDYPYIHWAEPFSVSVIRYKELFFLSDEEFVQAEIPMTDNWAFALYNPESVTAPVEYDDNQFSDIESCASGRITLHGQALKGKYAHQLIIICRSDVEGEFIEDFRIDGIPYKIGAEFWGENESLRINLANQGTEIPELVGKAIYGSDLHEDNPDWVLLNRKFRELLIQHMDVMDNKGSYKSLLNALKWFEYQDLAELREVWKFQTPDGTKYYDHPVDTFITEEAKARMFNSSKSTYFALRSLKRRIVGFEDSAIQKPIYEGTKYEHDPLEGELKTLACKWSEEEMRLKMVLLGNFFETYFMPIHTDLIRSVVEDIHASVIKVQTGTLDDVHEECYTEANDFDFEWSGGTPDNPDNPNDPNNPNGDKKFYLREIHAYAGLPQKDSYAQAFEDAATQLSSKTYELEYVPIMGCHELDDANVASDNPFDLMRGQLYNGIGAIVTGNFKFDENIVSGECESNQWGNFVKSTMTADGSKKEFSVNFLFPAPGDFKFIFRFVGVSGKVYSRIADITITDNLVVDLEFYALVAGTDRMHETPNPFTSEPEPKYMFSRTQERNYVLEDTIYNLKDGTTIPATKLWLDKDWGQYSQFIPIREVNDKTFHWQAPYMTKVRKMFFTGTRAQALCGLYINQIKENYWYEKLTNESGDVQLRYCTKRRDDVMPTAPKIPGVTVVDSDVFFPELHTLMKVKGEVYHGIPIVCRPVLRFADTNETVNYSNLITAKDFSWEFYSWGVQRNINEISTSSDDALMSWNYAVRLPRGYYTATFRYRFGNKDVEIKKQTPFRLVNEFTPLSHA